MPWKWLWSKFEAGPNGSTRDGGWMEEKGMEKNGGETASNICGVVFSDFLHMIFVKHHRNLGFFAEKNCFG